jgi:hypothetical protein
MVTLVRGQPLARSLVVSSKGKRSLRAIWRIVVGSTQPRQAKAVAVDIQPVSVRHSVPSFSFVRISGMIAAFMAGKACRWRSPFP